MSENAGSAGLFAVGDANPIVSGSAGRLLSVLGGDDYGATTSWINGNGTHGSCSEYDNRVRAGGIAVGGSFSINPVTADLAYLLPKILGTAPSGTTYALSDSALAFVIQKKLSSSLTLTYPTNYVAQATFSGAKDEPLLTRIDAVGLTEVDNVAFPSLTPPVDTDMLVFNDLVLTLGGDTYSVTDFSLTVQNALVPDNVNNRNVTAWTKTGRVITLSHTLPEADVDQDDFKDQSVAAVLTFSYNAQSLVFTLPAVRYTVMSPKFAGRGGVNRFPLTGQAFRTSGSLELVTTLDHTP